MPTMSHTITVTPRERHPGTKQRWTLEILAAAGLRGCTGATSLAHRFSVDMLADLVHDGLATAHRQSMRVGRRKAPVCPHDDNGRRPEGARRLSEIGRGTRRYGRRWIHAWGCQCVTRPGL